MVKEPFISVATPVFGFDRATTLAPRIASDLSRTTPFTFIFCADISPEHNAENNISKTAKAYRFFCINLIIEN